MALGAVIIFILTKDDLPLLASVTVGAVAVALSVYVVTAMTNRIAQILNAAPHEAALPTRIPLSAFFVDLLNSSSNLDVLVAKWFWGCMCIASIVVPPAKYLKSENIGWTDAVAMLAFGVFSYVLFRAFSAERQRRKGAAVTDKA